MNTIREATRGPRARDVRAAGDLQRRQPGRARPEPEDPIRPAFQRDRDRVVHSKAFRRLKHKTQVFFSPAGDHYRTRLTHTLEVSQIARTLAKVLRLHEELTEAITLAHDLGHTPFGHAGERVLDKLVPGGFSHATQSLRIVEVLEQGGEGLNLTYEVRQGISTHSKGKHGLPINVPAPDRAATLEAQIARVADIIAYVNHDIDDAVRAGVLDPADLPSSAVAVLGTTSSARIGAMVTDVVQQSLACDLSLRMSEPVLQALLDSAPSCSSTSTRTTWPRPSSPRPPEFWAASGRRSGGSGDLAGRADPGARGPGRGRQGLPGRHDRPVRRAPVRGTLHPSTLDRGPAGLTGGGPGAVRRTSPAPAPAVVRSGAAARCRRPRISVESGAYTCGTRFPVPGSRSRSRFPFPVSRFPFPVSRFPACLLSLYVRAGPPDWRC